MLPILQYGYSMSETEIENETKNNVGHGGKVSDEYVTINTQFTGSFKIEEEDACYGVCMNPI